MKSKILLLTLLLASCKDDHWGDKALSFAHNEAPAIVETLSQKDLELKWFEYYQTALTHSLEEVTKANLMLNSFEELDFKNIDTDKTKLMKTAYQLDQQIEKLYTINSILYNAKQTRDALLNACENQEQVRIYTENRTYLLSALQLSAPQLNITYGIVATFDTGDGDSKKGIEQQKRDNNMLTVANSLPLVSDITAIFIKKSYNKNLGKFNEAQTFINNIKLDSAKVAETSNAICRSNKMFFKQASDELDNNLFVVQGSLTNLYLTLTGLKESLSPKVIAAIIETRFSSQEKEIYSVEADNQFTARLMAIYKTIQSLSSFAPQKSEDLMELEKRIDILDDFSNEITLKKNSILGKKNAALMEAMLKLLNLKKGQLSAQFRQGVRS